MSKFEMAPSGWDGQEAAESVSERAQAAFDRFEAAFNGGSETVPPTITVAGAGALEDESFSRGRSSLGGTDIVQTDHGYYDFEQSMPLLHRDVYGDAPRLTLRETQAFDNWYVNQYLQRGNA